MKAWKIILLAAFALVLPLAMRAGSASAAEDGLSDKQRDALVTFINTHGNMPFYSCLKYSDGVRVLLYTQPLYTSCIFCPGVGYKFQAYFDGNFQALEGVWSAGQQKYVDSGSLQSNSYSLGVDVESSIENVMVYTNHDHYDGNGNLFFQQSPLLAPMAAVLATQGALEVGKVAKVGEATIPPVASSVLLLTVLVVLVIKYLRSSTAL